jgi:type II secretory pathway component PulF
MPTFEYQAQRQDGSVEEGLIDGLSLDNAARDLAAKGLRVTQIGFQSQAAPKERTFQRPTQPTPETGPRSYFETSVAGPVVGKVPLENLAFFFRQASAMQKAGVGLVQSLNTLAGQAKNPKLGSILREVSAAVQAGRPMTSVIQRYPEAFSPVIVSMLRAGEEGGFLDEAFGTISDYIDQEIELRNLYRRTTFWPKLELALSVVVILGANTSINAIKPDAQKLSSPLTTAATWFVLLPLIIGGFLFFRVGLANPRIRYNYDLFTSRIPYVGNTLQQIAMARFGRAFGALYRAGVPIPRAFTLAADACGNEYLRAKMYPAQQSLQAGDGITDTLESTHAFSPIVMDMIRTGETTGNLDQMLTRSSDFYIEEARLRQHQLGIAVGIFIGTFVAIYIGYIVVTFWMNYMANMQNVGAGA